MLFKVASMIQTMEARTFLHGLVNYHLICEVDSLPGIVLRHDSHPFPHLALTAVLWGQDSLDHGRGRGVPEGSVPPQMSHGWEASNFGAFVVCIL